MEKIIHWQASQPLWGTPGWRTATHWFPESRKRHWADINTRTKSHDNFKDVRICQSGTVMYNKPLAWLLGPCTHNLPNSLCLLSFTAPSLTLPCLTNNALHEIHLIILFQHFITMHRVYHRRLASGTEAKASSRSPWACFCYHSSHIATSTSKMFKAAKLKQVQ